MVTAISGCRVANGAARQRRGRCFNKGNDFCVFSCEFEVCVATPCTSSQQSVGYVEGWD